MARRKKGQKVDGWVILDKPAGITSTAAVAAVKRLFDAQKAGHGGTLDPLATGILPIALGEATKTVPFVMDGEKTYRFTLTFGEARSTDDAEGEVTARSDRRPSDAEIEAILPRFQGEITQVPPAFSAIKVQGERAYDLAREGEVVELQPRTVLVHEIRLAERPDPDHAVIEVRCGKGTYMRALARDIAVALGTVGHVAALRRTGVGPFTEAGAISLDPLKALGHSPAAFKHVLPIETALDDIPALALSAAEATRLRSGQPVGLLHRLDRDRIRGFTPGDMVCAMSEGRLVALTRFEAGELVPVRVMNL
ncbi:MAG TPA: tRNA pseudouridine(55) synthase TruB [Candidatus Cybelea sp.]|nr:tRNA pseudouridine(55) synthase TruB [Candidatus Cybelea sp.]